MVPPALSAAPWTLVPDFENDNTLSITLHEEDIQERWFVHGVSLKLYYYYDKNILLSNTGRIEQRKEKLRITCKTTLVEASGFVQRKALPSMLKERSMSRVTKQT